MYGPRELGSAVASRRGCRVSLRWLVGDGGAELQTVLAGAGDQGPPPAAVRAYRWGLRRLWVVVISRHSVLTAPHPRRRKRSMPRLNLVFAKTGSMIAWRWP